MISIPTFSFRISHVHAKKQLFYCRGLTLKSAVKEQQHTSPNKPTVALITTKSTVLFCNSSNYRFISKHCTVITVLSPYKARILTNTIAVTISTCKPRVQVSLFDSVTIFLSTRFDSSMVVACTPWLCHCYAWINRE